jgi:hypothetical protein
VSAAEIELLDDDGDEDFVFEPTAWDLAMAIGLALEGEAERAALEELADAMLVWADDDESERVTDRAVAAIWTDELRGAIREGLGRVARLGDEWVPAATSALEELERTAERAEVARAVVQRFAMQRSQEDHPSRFCVCCLDDAVREAPPEQRRELARRVAIVARRNAAIPETELRAVLETAMSESPVRRLAARERREAVRARLGRIGRLARTSMPELAAELAAIGAESLPKRPEDDDVWCAVCELLLADLARPEWN